MALAKGLTFLFLLLGGFDESHGQDMSTFLMNSTFRLQGPARGKPGLKSFGTVFIIGKPIPPEPGKTEKRAYYVLVTAAHVLDEVEGDNAELTLRSKNVDGSYTSFPYSVAIRKGKVNFYTRHPTSDVAAMYVSLPEETAIQLLPLSFLVDDARLKALEVHPGDELLCLGFPLDVDLNGFPVVRSGLLASYPIVPAVSVKTYYYNFHVFPGNSGGPVYFEFHNRVYGGATNIGVEAGVVGLVAQQASSKEFPDEKLDVSVIVPAFFIRETIALLPEKP